MGRFDCILYLQYLFKHCQKPLGGERVGRFDLPYIVLTVFVQTLSEAPGRGEGGQV